MSFFENFSQGSGNGGKGGINPSMRITLRAVVSGYIAYLGYSLLRGGPSEGGEKPLPEWARISVGVLFLLAGAGFFAFAAYDYYKVNKAEQQAAAQAEQERKERLSDEESGGQAFDELASERCAEVRGMYDDYIAAARKARERSKPTDGLFGVGKDARSADCHEEFYYALSDKLDEYAAEPMEPAEARALAAYIIGAPQEHREDKLVFPIMFAAAGLAKKLVPFLAPADADRLAIEFSENFPKPERMPAQEQLLQALYDRARG